MQPRKALLWQQLKTAREMGTPIDFTKTYVQYTEAELEYLIREYIGVENDAQQAPSLAETAEAALAEFTGAAAVATPLAPAAGRGAQGTGEPLQVASRWPLTLEGRIDWDAVHSQPLERQVELLNLDQPRNKHVVLSDEPERMAGIHFYTHSVDDPIRIDSSGKIWFQDEIIKPAIPRPRARRIVNHANAEVVMDEIRDETGHLQESFEVAGQPSGVSQHKVTMATWQTGIYKDPRLPFRLHIYNGVYAFSHRDVAMFYGGTKLIPTAVQKETKYVGGDLCFDLSAVRDSIEREYRERVLRKETLDV